ncbi:MAG: ArnT family glycosyltransferase [Anaerolineae bacterium]
MVFLARFPIVLLMLGLALAGFRFARALWGTGWLAFFFILFDPNILAHGRYATTDVGGAFFGLLAVWAVWRLWQRSGWDWRRWGTAVLTLGLAFSAKLSILAFAPMLALMAFLPQRDGFSWRGARRRLAQLALAGVVSLLVVWAVFGFEWGVYHFASAGLAGWNGRSGPLPTFLAGIEQIAGLTGGGRGSTFLLGRFSDSGFAAYFPVAFLVKTPLVTLLLLGTAVIVLLRNKETRGTAVFLLTPILLYFALSMQSAFNIGYRHLLPVLPLVMVLIGGLVPRITHHASRITYHVSRFAPLLLILTTLAIHPHYVSYFNLAAGGPANGYHILVDSNVDWGQDLLRLRNWMNENRVDSVKLAWFGTADPGYYGIRYEPLPGLGRSEFFLKWWDVPFDTQQPEPGVYAISVTNLWELPLQEAEKTRFAWFRAHEPDARVGYSILIYRVE